MNCYWRITAFTACFASGSCERGSRGPRQLYEVAETLLADCAACGLLGDRQLGFFPSAAQHHIVRCAASDVGLDNAAAIFTAAKHSKSVVSLDTANHLPTREADSRYAAQALAAWSAGICRRRLPRPCRLASSP
jgi:hypothetical protein